MKKHILIILVSMLITSILHAQNFDYRFEVSKPGSSNQLMAIAQTSDGYYHAATHDTTNFNLFISKYDKRGKYVMEKKLNIIPSTPNEIILYFNLVGMKSLPDKSLLILCNLTTTFNSIDTKDKIILMRVDSTYNVLFTKEMVVNYQGANQTRATQMVLDIAKNNCFISGNIIDSVGNKFSYLLKSDINGVVNFSKASLQGSFAVAGNYYNNGLAISNSGSIYTYEICSGCDSTMLIKFDPAGNMVFKKAIHMNGGVYQISCHPQTNQILLTGIKTVGIKWTSLYVKADSNGNVLASNYYQDTTYETSFRGAIPTNDKGWMIYTSKNTANLSTGDFTRMGIVKMDSTDHVQYNYFYKNDCLSQICKDDFISTKDQGYAFITPTDGFTGISNIYICKTDSLVKPICNTKVLVMQSHPFTVDMNSETDSSRNAQITVQNLNHLNTTVNLPSTVLCIDSTLNITSVNEVNIESNCINVSTLPNHLIIENSFNLLADIKLFAADGSCILSVKSSAAKIDLPLSISLANGLYFYSITTNKQVLSGKLMKY